MKTKSIVWFNLLHVLSWIIFIGLCIKTAALFFSYLFSMVVNPNGASDLYLGLNLSGLYVFDTGYFSALVLSMVIIMAMKAYIFYLVIRIFLKLNLVHPFSSEVAGLISKISYEALAIGFLSFIVSRYVQWLTKKGAVLPSLNDFLGSADEFLFLGGVIFVIAQVFRRGVEIQSENDLTV